MKKFVAQTVWPQSASGAETASVSAAPRAAASRLFEHAAAARTRQTTEMHPTMVFIVSRFL